MARGACPAAARAFACAVGALSPFWFEQAQNARGYALGMLLSAAMLAAVPLGMLFLAGLLGSFTHAYLLLAFGMVLLYRC